jgi:diacylglycerol O-acyltransferase
VQDTACRIRQDEVVVRPLAPNSAFFLYGETRDQPLHVGGLQLFTPADGSNAGELGRQFSEGIVDGSVIRLLHQKATRSLTTLGQWVWEDDAEFQMEHHVRRSALPQPGRVLELLALCSRLHSTLLDRHRPLWEVHLIEGLADGRFALYFKAHHALLDGVAAMRMLARTLSGRPDQRGMPPPWAPQLSARTRHASLEERPSDLLRATADAVRDVLGIAPSLAKRAARGLTGGGLPLQAPRSVLNVPITGARRVAAQDWPIERIKAVAAASGTTVNDVVLAMCSGALRAYLLMRDALPEQSLIAMVPVSLRSSGGEVDEASDEGEGGNAVGAVLCDLGTQHTDPAARLDTIHRSMVEGKRSLVGMSQVQIVAMSSLVLSPVVVEHLLHSHGHFRPPFNVLISNVPGPSMPMFWNGARMDGLYPLGVPFNGQALNITCASSAGRMGFGIVGCSRSVPSLQRIIGFLEDELTALEKAVA